MVEALAAGDLNQIDIPASDLIRMAELMRQYIGFPLGVAGASVIAVAERLRASEVATLDHPCPRLAKWKVSVLADHELVVATGCRGCLQTLTKLRS